MADLKIVYSGRGFALVEFSDRNGEGCSLQKSSIATEDCIWLGVDRPKIIEGIAYGRMHLNQEQVAALLPLLQAFVETGDLEEEVEDG